LYGSTSAWKTAGKIARPAGKISNIVRE
jgi:hypothetical protein